VTQPYDFGEAKAKAREAAALQRGAEKFMREASKEYALAEEAFRVALATRIVELRAEGQPATLARDLARGDKDVAAKKRLSMIAEGVKEAAVQEAWRRANDRRELDSFIQWSMRRDLAEGFGNAPAPQYDSPIGGRK